jgi:hypothetical protein
MERPKLVFHVRCSKDHDTQQIFTREQLQAKLAAGAMSFWCVRCDERWTPTVDERVRLRGLAKRPAAAARARTTDVTDPD